MSDVDNDSELGGYPHVMLKEIMEQPVALRETMRGRLIEGEAPFSLAELNLSTQEIRSIESIYIVACGTSYHAGLIAKHAIEQLLHIPVHVNLAPEFNGNDPLLGKNVLTIVISQSGETTDALAALRLLRGSGHRVLAITNVADSTLSREADMTLYTRAGLEEAIASTKAYLTQLIVLYLLAYYLAQERGALAGDDLREAKEALLMLPEQVERVLTRLPEIKQIAHYLHTWENVFFLGRNLDYAIAMEGALKLKETSYIHAEAYASGEFQHGSIALIVKGLPVVALVTRDDAAKKSLANIIEIKNRFGYVICFLREGLTELSRKADQCFFLPAAPDLFMPVLCVVPLQLLAYCTAVLRGNPVDKPRNLTKVVIIDEQ